ncbi:MAG: DUF4251 domain-containing protein [Ferruginibacter sp.]
MKTLRNILVPVFLLACIINGQVTNAQKTPSAKQISIRNAVDSQQFVFKAQYASPAGGRQRFLTSEYVVMVSKDTVLSDLPFFGRAYSAPLDPTDAGIKFTSSDFYYDRSIRKKGGWIITIKPKDTRDVQQLTLTIFDNGSASLQVLSNNRQPISFSGTVAAKKQKT